MKQYGYARISTGKQNIERQIRNIKAACPNAIIVKETYTGTKFQGRKELEKLLGKIQKGDSIIFDSVSRMSRNAEDGFLLYEELFGKGIELVFVQSAEAPRVGKCQAFGRHLTLTHICWNCRRILVVD